MTLDREAFFEGYLAEVEDHLAVSGKNLLAVEANLARGESHPRAVRDLFRSVHTVKGLSGMVGVDPIVNLAHAMEEALRTADRGGGRLSRAAVDALARGLRAIEQRLRLFGARQPVPEAPAALLEELAASHELELDAPEPPEGQLPSDLAEKLTLSERAHVARGIADGRSLVRLDFVPSAERAAKGLNITWVRERLAERADLVRVFPVSLPSSEGVAGGLVFTLLALHDGDPAALATYAGIDADATTVVARPAAADAPGPDEELIDDAEARRGQIVRVEVSRLDAALERLSAMVVNRFRLLRALTALAEAGADVRTLKEIVAENGRQLRDLRAAIMRTRMVPVDELLERVPLIVRGLSRTTGKPVTVEIDAGHAEVDKSVGERVFPAVVHLVRNAVDHALEPAAERRTAGKPEQGCIRVSSNERGSGQLEITVTDDGRGIDIEALARRAGRPVPDTNEKLLDLVALPGLSTTERATTTSGRGMGVDIVRRIVQDLGGALHVETRPGAGTSFRLRVPLSLTIIDAFSFSAAGQSYIVPVSAVEEIIEIDPARVMPAPWATSNGVTLGLYERRGESLPLLHLDAVLNTGAARPPAGASSKAIVVRRGAAPYGFVIDRMLGQQVVVVRPIANPLVNVPGVTGATDLGDGRPTLLLDLTALSAHLGGPRTGVRS